MEQAFAKQKENDIQCEMINRIADKVGRDNLIVKLHPASDVNKYSNYNLNIIKTSNFMELILLNINIENQVVFSICSSAAFNFYLAFGKKTKIILLYNLFESVSLSQGIKSFIHKFASIYTSNWILMPNSFSEFDNILGIDSDE